MDDKNPNMMIAGREGDEAAAFLPELKWMEEDARRWRFRKTTPLKPYTYTLSFQGVRIAPLGDIHALTGKSGNGKTMTFTAMIVALLGKAQGELRCCLPAGRARKVVYVDTEMGLNDTNLVVKRVYTLMGWDWSEDREEFQVYRLREVTDIAQRWRIVLKAMWEERPEAVFLDGMLDFVDDLNDNGECMKLVREVMAAATVFNVSLWCLLHENPGNEKMAGHLGTALERKVTEVLVTEKKKEGGFVRFVVTQKKARGGDVPDICFTVQPAENGIWVPMIEELPFTPVADRSSLPSGEAVDPKVVEMVRKEIRPNGVTTRELLGLLKDFTDGNQAKASRLASRLVDKHVLYRADNKRYYLDNAGNHAQTEMPLDDKPDDLPF